MESATPESESEETILREIVRYPMGINSQGPRLTRHCSQAGSPADNSKALKLLGLDHNGYDTLLARAGNGLLMRSM